MYIFSYDMQKHFRPQTQYHRNTTGKMLFTYTRLRDGIYLVSILLCFLSFLLNSNGNTLGADGSLQKVFASDEHREPLLLLFMCATTLELSFLPNLLVESLQINSKKDAIDSFLHERFLFILFFTVHSLVGLCGVYQKNEHTAILYYATNSVLVSTFAYIATRVLEHSTFTKIWTGNLILA
jgi:hypothetical protein